jgi:hypothetical protein
MSARRLGEVGNARKSSRTTIKLENGEGRVYLLLQNRGDTLKLIAICKPKSRARVARALEEVRYAFSLRGTAMESSVQEGASCM